MRRKVMMLVLFVAFVLGTGAIFAWFDFLGPARPPGVSEREWTPLSSSLGLVVQERSPGKSGGYLMRRVDGQWERVVLVDPDTMGFIPAR